MDLQLYNQCHKRTLFCVFLMGMVLTLCVQMCVLMTKGTLSVSWNTAFKPEHSLTRNRTKGAFLHSFGEYATIPDKVNVVNCQALFDGNLTEAAKAKNLTKKHFPDHALTPNEYLANRSSDCNQYVRDSGYITNTLTEKEAMFPIAFGIVMYKDAAQVENLLRAIYRPQNVYCIQLDSSSDEQVKCAIASVARCFPNVFLSKEIIDVQWSKLSVVKADIACMRTLFEKSKKWKYFINLTGQEFPLKTNGELVEILRAFKGASNVNGKRERVMAYRYKVGKPPHGFKPVTGSTHVVLGRPFVEFILHDQRAKDYLNWTGRVHIPDETFVQTLYLTPSLEIPGAYKYDELQLANDSKITRFKFFRKATTCRGRIARGVCILGVDYLQDMAKSRALFANKFHWDYEPVALQCMEELVYNRTRDEYLGQTTFNATWYSKLDFVHNQIQGQLSL